MIRSVHHLPQIVSNANDEVFLVEVFDVWEEWSVWSLDVY